MLLYTFPALVTSFPRAFIIECNANNGTKLTSCLFPALMTCFPVEFINEKATGCTNEEAIRAINEAAIGAIVAPRNSPFLFRALLFQ